MGGKEMADAGKEGKETKGLEPAQISQAWKMAEDVLDKAGDAWLQALPYLKQVWAVLKAVWELLQPFHPEEFAPALFGLFLVFFGGRFLTTVAAAEAMRLGGFKNLVRHGKILFAKVSTGLEAARKEEPAKQAADSSFHASQKLRSIMKSVDPNEVIEAAGGIYSICFTVIATLRFKFAATVTLGSSIGDVFSDAADHVASPVLQRSMEPEYQKWAEVIVRFSCKAIGVALAWMLQRFTSAVHCALRGAKLFASGAQRAALRLKYIKAPLLEEDSPAFSAVVTAIAVVGIVEQVRFGFGLPFPLNVFLLPASLFETVLTQVVGTV